MTEPRRSKRTHPANYNSNGRDYLASIVGWSRDKLDHWLTSSTVHPHLLLWYNLCVLGRRRFKDGIEWIETGYFYNSNDLEEDIFFMCMGEGNMSEVKGIDGGYADEQAKTSKWMTQEIWARTAWRIVQDNCSKGGLFERAMIEHPAAAYGFTIEILCIAFHSIQQRNFESIWVDIIANAGESCCLPPTPSTGETAIINVLKEVQLDRDMETDTSSSSQEDSEMETDDDEDSEVVMSDDEDDDFVVPKTPEREGSSIVVATPRAPKKCRATAPNKSLQEWLDSLPAIDDEEEENEEDKEQREKEGKKQNEEEEYEEQHETDEVNTDVEMETAYKDPLALNMIDEDGQPITGYRMAPWPTLGTSAA